MLDKIVPTIAPPESDPAVSYAISNHLKIFKICISFFAGAFDEFSDSMGSNRAFPRDRSSIQHSAIARPRSTRSHLP
ncbi:hypothetical protein JJD41_02495 [Oxynema sp. CENA135]|uniref:hypothetical protein n=1 Tax=Oxynema sp. CENA135 TaxID=984206 RepID=UPI00190CB6C7|nr:hypothetical protein [Oxynema sp. CENA135]MBK4728759.1 hypothetical protein [Oxynema sp. CENA135]